jgi:hypothetical protein
MEKIIHEKDEENKSLLVSQLIDLSLLSQQMLTGEALAAFIKRSWEILK